MNIHTIYGAIFKIWRSKRMLKFEQLIQPCADDLLIDVGGHPETWITRPQITKRIDCVNLNSVSWNADAHSNYRITTTIDDGCALNLEDSSYDILFSNSVIEHVGDWEKQQTFAQETSRVGKKLWIQTPAFECPFEPHFLAPFVHWFPIKIRRHLLRWLTPWGWLQKPTQEEIDQTILSTRLLTKQQVIELFPDCIVITERLLGIFPKSYIAYRTENGTVQ